MRTLIGLLVIFLGVAFLLEATNIASFDNAGQYFWPILVMGVALLAYRNNPRSWGGPAIIFLVGLTMLAETMHWFAQSPWTYVWPVFIIVFGMQILVGKHGGKVKASTGHADSFAVFSGVEEKKGGAFDGGTVSATFGGVKLDLREADIKDGSVIQVWAAFGGSDIFVPKNVKVTTSVLPLFGGADNKTNPDAGATKTLHITGTALFGGVSVKN